MSEFTDAVYDRLAGDEELCELLSSYTDDDGVSGPCIFADKAIPPDADRPYLWIREINEAADNVKNAHGRTLAAQIGCYVDAREQTATLEAIKECVWILFDGVKLTLDSNTSTRPIRVAVSEAPTDDTIKGKLIDLSSAWFET